VQRAPRLVVLLFWSLWLTVVTASNVTNALRVAQVLPTRFAFASSNFQLIEAATAVYGAPRAVVWLLFAGVIAWEATAAALFWRALLRARAGDDQAAGERAAAAALATALGLFAAFMVADELLINYAIQATHMRIFIGLAVSWLVMRSPAR
jgi:hypothetical protein